MNTTADANPAPDPVDLKVGARIRLRRTQIKQSQSDLAAQIGVTFQQVQKYERGANRVSASMLVKIAKAQGLTPGDYFEDVDGLEHVDLSPEKQAISDWLGTAEAWPIAEAISRLSQPRQRAVLDVARAMAVA